MSLRDVSGAADQMDKVTQAERRDGRETTAAAQQLTSETQTLRPCPSASPVGTGRRPGARRRPREASPSRLAGPRFAPEGTGRADAVRRIGRRRAEAEADEWAEVLTAPARSALRPAAAARSAPPRRLTAPATGASGPSSRPAAARQPALFSEPEDVAGAAPAPRLHPDLLHGEARPSEAAREGGSGAEDQMATTPPGRSAAKAAARPAAP